ncbi:MAG TPA: MFS transporter [Acidimicrobiales bacterium]|nr:MFS transporter [Acidimicrobiales bacterium]
MTGGSRAAPRAVAVPRRSYDVLAMYAFVALGLPDGMIGTAWPSLRHAFGAPVGDLGIALLVATAGSLLSSSIAGLLLARTGARGTIALGATAGALGAAGIVLSPAFWAFVTSGLGLGLAAGLIDSAGNASVAMSGRTRLLNFVHGCYGVGTSFGPLVITAGLLLGSWRASYGSLVLVDLVLAFSWWFAGRGSTVQAGSLAAPETVQCSSGAGSLSSTSSQASGATEGRGKYPPTGAVPAKKPNGQSRPQLISIVGVGLLVFMVYVGLEVGAGQWEASYARGPLHLSETSTGFATFGYWGALMVVRFALAAPRRPVPPAAVLRWGCVVALLATALVWWRPSVVAALVGLVVLGGALAGVFPALMALTPLRVGEDIAHHVIGWQIGASSLGGSGISAMFGVIFQRYGLREFGPCLVVVAVLLVFGVLAFERVSSTRPAAAPAA